MLTSFRTVIAAGVLGLAALSPQQVQAGRTSFSIGIGIGGGYRHGGYASFGYSHGYYRPYYRSNWCGPYIGLGYCPPPVVYYSNPVYYSPPVVYSTPVYSSAPVYVPQPVAQTVVTPPRYSYVDSVPNTAQIVAAPATQTTHTTAAPTQTPPPVPAQETNTLPPTQPAAIQPAAPRSAGGDGWALLGANDTRSALDAFAAAAEQSAQSGVAKVGYSLTAAFLGDDAKSVWALRRALLVEPESLNKIPLTAPIQNQLHAVAQRLQTRVTEGFYRSDDLFLIAALQFVDGQYPAADAALTRAISQGDKEQTTATLKTLIDMKLKGPFKYDYKP